MRKGGKRPLQSREKGGGEIKTRKQEEMERERGEEKRDSERQDGVMQATQEPTETEGIRDDLAFLISLLDAG